MLTHDPSILSAYAVDDLSKVFVNPTGVSRFGCETKWANHTLLGVDKRRGPSTDARDRGKAMHVFVDRYVRRYALTGELDPFTGREGRAVAREIFTELDEDEAISFDDHDAVALLEAARAQLPKLGLERFEVVMLNGEPCVELDLRTSTGVLDFQAIVDCVLRHKTTGELWLIDWKTTLDTLDTLKTNNYVECDLQLAIQRLVLRAHGIYIDRSALVQIRAVAPEPPPLTTRNKVTRNLKNVSCDVDTYRQALLDNNEAIGLAELEKLRALERSPFVRWLPDITTPAADDALVHELYAKRERMQAIAEGQRLPLLAVNNFASQHRYGGSCTKCDYFKWCRGALLNGGQPDFSLVGIDYVRNDKATFEPVKAEHAPDPAGAYVEYAKAYGLSVNRHEVFVP